ncbi:isopenicillin N synthase family dioxygenase [Actinocorallia longicatena]|uniref:Isopenicillin N synthase family oxygenase n=1 Tax=Actinocorallia longicatena TaxID=111803 RepID=A0ABP6QKT0_9ACTN
MDLPVIDVTSLVAGGDTAPAAAAIGRACRAHGFFYVTGHGVDPALQRRLDTAARAFFALPEAEKERISMIEGGTAWRGFFPVGGELTSGRPDLKEGLYFGSELPADDPRVLAGVPLHGPNLFPAAVPELRGTVLEWIEALTSLGRAVLRGVALSLGLPASHFEDGITRDPTVLFRIFHYPPSSGPEWGVGEHTDYGLLTLLAQDRHGGLQVRTPGGWLDAPPLPGTFVCNIGDMLDRLTGGRYRSAPHRVRNTSGHGRLSFPFFFDPGFTATIPALPRPPGDPGRWDGGDLSVFGGTYGDYLTAKVARVFPALWSAKGTA